jgi:hypothetical protein
MLSKNISTLHYLNYILLNHNPSTNPLLSKGNTHVDRPMIDEIGSKQLTKDSAHNKIKYSASFSCILYMYGQLPKMATQLPVKGNSAMKTHDNNFLIHNYKGKKFQTQTIKKR